MESDPIDNLVRDWARLGAGFDVDAELAMAHPVDLERVVLETARHAPKMARLFVMAATWLHRYGDMVAKKRLGRLARQELDRRHWAVLGLLLDVAQQGTHPAAFASITRGLGAAAEPGPLFEASRGSGALRRLAEDSASAVSRRWGLWCREVEFKSDALRPAEWIIARNPELRTRADHRGDLRASVLATLRHDAEAGRSEVRLAGLAGGSRAQVRAALRNLEMAGRVVRRRPEGGGRVVVQLGEVA